MSTKVTLLRPGVAAETLGELLAEAADDRGIEHSPVALGASWAEVRCAPTTTRHALSLLVDDLLAHGAVRLERRA